MNLWNTNFELIVPEEVKDNKDKLQKFIYSLGLPQREIQLSDLFLSAFIHKSYAADFKVITSHNERLEFLGDGVLGAVICKLLFINYPDMSEATMSLYKIALVREETLAEVAREIGLNKHIFLSKGEEKADWRDKDTILGDAFEAFLWRIYCEWGEEVVFDFVKKYLFPKMKESMKHPVKSYKSLVQEYCLKEKQKLPEYKDREEKLDNEPVFISELRFLDKKMSEWKGKNKKAAESEAAKVFWESI